jgi:hypothetical protein
VPAEDFTNLGTPRLSPQESDQGTGIENEVHRSSSRVS